MTSPGTDFFAIMGLVDWRVPRVLGEESSTEPSGAPSGFATLAPEIAKYPGTIVSFDIFDTLIIRDIAPPDALLDNSAKFIQAALQAFGIAASLAELRAARQRKTEELRAVAQSSGADGEVLADDVIEASLAAIMAAHGHPVPDTLVGRTKAFEFNQEVLHCTAAPGARDMLAELSATHRIVAISDSHWSADQLRQLLAHCGLDKFIGAIYSSGDVGLNKRSGRLFEHVLTRESCSAQRLLHIGDHAGSDYQVPHGLGIRAVLLAHPDAARRYRQIEQRLFLARQFGYPPDDLNRGGTTMTSLPHRLGGEIFSLPFFLFALHVLALDNQHRFERILFLSRDGFLPWEAFRALAAGIDLYVANRAAARSAYVQLSRVSTTIPDIAGSLNALAAFDEPGCKTYDERWSHLCRLGVAESDLPLLAQRLRLAVDDQSSLIDILSGRTDLRTEITGYLDGKRAALESYLESIGFFAGADAKVLCVDIGWKGSVLRNIERLFGHRPDYPQVHGAFWGVARDFSDNRFHLHPGYFFDSERAAPLEALVRRCHEAFEAVSAEATGGCVGYRVAAAGVVPRVADHVDSPATAVRREVQQGVLEGLPTWIAWFNKYLIGDELRVTALARMLQALVNRTSPFRNVLMDLRLDFDLGSQRSIRLGDLLDAPSADLRVHSQVPVQIAIADGARSPAYAYERLLALIGELTLAKRPLVLWGMGVVGRLLLPHLRPFIRFAVDSNPSIQGRTMAGLAIMTPEQLLGEDLTDHLVVFTALNRRPQLDLTVRGARLILVDDRLV